MKLHKVLTQILLASILVAFTPVTHADDDGISERLDKRIMLRLHPGQSLTAFIDAFEADHPNVRLFPLDAVASRDIYLVAIAAPFGTNLDQIELDLETNYVTQLRWGEFLYVNEAPEGHTGSVFVDHPVAGLVFNDQYVSDQIGVPSATSISTGGNIVVAVLDTGIDSTHPELADRMLIGWNFVENNVVTSDVADGYDNDNDGLVDEMYGHGTFVAGLIHLTAPDARILPIKVLNSDGVGDGWILTKAMFFAIDRGVEVINLSLGSTYNAQGVEDAIEEAKSVGIVTVAAAGNLNRNEPEEFPAMKDDTIGVAAVDLNDVKAPFSNFSEDLSISAPGLSVMNNGEPDVNQAISSTVPGGGYAFWDGTSTAVPLVSGTVALIRAQHPEWPSPGSGVESLEQVQPYVKWLLATTSVNIDGMNPQHAGQLGAGRLNAAAAVTAGPPMPALGDLNADGVVNIQDLVRLLVAWGTVHSSADLNADGIVNQPDLVRLLLSWTYQP